MFWEIRGRNPGKYDFAIGFLASCLTEQLCPSSHMLDHQMHRRRGKEIQQVTGVTKRYASLSNMFHCRIAVSTNIMTECDLACQNAEVAVRMQMYCATGNVDQIQSGYL